MKFSKLKTLSGLLLAGSAAFAGGANAAIVDFQTVPAATFGGANESSTSTFTGGCADNSCYVQNGIVVGVVKDPLDSGAHFHRAGVAADREAQYHPDSTGVYVRQSDLSKFSLQSIDLNVIEAGTGNFVLYGYANALNPGLLTSNVGTPFPGGELNPTDPEGGTVAPIASYTIPTTFNGTVSLTDLLAQDSDWGNIGAFWVTYKGFNHSPTASYALGSYPDWDIRLDNINLGAPVAAPVPVPGAVWLFGSVLVGFISRNRKKASV